MIQCALIFNSPCTSSNINFTKVGAIPSMSKQLEADLPTLRYRLNFINLESKSWSLLSYGLQDPDGLLKPRPAGMSVESRS
jgi:hypothetical protein